MFTTVRILFAALIAMYLPLLTYAEDVARPNWYVNSQNEWCFRLAYKHACLPDGYRITRFESGHAAFRFQSDHFTYYIEYELGNVRSKLEVEYHDCANTDPVPEGCLSLSQSTQRDAVALHEFQVDIPGGGRIQQTTFVLDFDETFGLVIFSLDQDGSRDLAASLINQWNSSEE